MLDYNNFNGYKKECRCLCCLEDYECLSSAFYNLERKLSELHNLIRVMKKDEKDMFYLRRVTVVLKKIQQVVNITAKYPSYFPLQCLSV